LEGRKSIDRPAFQLIHTASKGAAARIGCPTFHFRNFSFNPNGRSWGLLACDLTTERLRADRRSRGACRIVEARAASGVNQACRHARRESSQLRKIPSSPNRQDGIAHRAHAPADAHALAERQLVHPTEQERRGVSTEESATDATVVYIEPVRYRNRFREVNDVGIMKISCRPQPPRTACA